MSDAWPSIDYAALAAHEPAALAQLLRAMRHVGFVYLAASPLEARRRDIFALSHAFFALPHERRMQIAMQHSAAFRGYSPFGTEVTQGQTDHRDQIDYAPEVPSRPSSSFVPHRLLGPNQFLPDAELPAHRRTTLDYFNAAQQLAQQLTRALEAALQLPYGSLERYMSSPQDDAYARMKAIRYPAGSAVDGTERKGDQGVGAHKDGGWLTLLATDTAKGLQVQLGTGQWVDVPHRPGCIIVNAGQQLERVSRGALVAATHRVRSEALGQERFSVAFFSMPALSAVVEPLPASLLGNSGAEALQARKSDVPAQDLWGAAEEPFGAVAWRGISRSHPNVVQRWHTDVA